MAISGADKMKDQSPDLFHKILDSPFEKELVDLVKTDLPRTFPDNIYFTKEANHQTHLFNILIAYAHNNRAVGYCQGLNYIAGMYCYGLSILPKYSSKHLPKTSKF